MSQAGQADVASALRDCDVPAVQQDRSRAPAAGAVGNHLGAAGRSAVLGLATGVVVLGIGGRALMRIIALAGGTSTGFSLGGSLEVVAAGALYGAVGGALFPYLPERLGPLRTVLHAGALFLLTALTSDAARGAAAAIRFPGRLLALLSFGMLLLGYSAVLARLVHRQAAGITQAGTSDAGPAAASPWTLKGRGGSRRP
jgi:hypothetical protein